MNMAVAENAPTFEPERSGGSLGGISPAEALRREGIFVKSAAYQTSPDGEPVWSDYCSYAILNDE